MAALDGEVSLISRHSHTHNRIFSTNLKISHSSSPWNGTHSTEAEVPPLHRTLRSSHGAPLNFGLGLGPTGSLCLCVIIISASASLALSLCYTQTTSTRYARPSRIVHRYHALELGRNTTPTIMRAATPCLMLLGLAGGAAAAGSDSVSAYHMSCHGVSQGNRHSMHRPCNASPWIRCTLVWC